MAKELRVLMVEDCEDDARLTIRTLERGGYKPIWDLVDTKEDMLKALKKTGAFELVISDYSMPRFDGLSALKTLQETGLDLPFIIVSGNIGEEIAVDAMKAGASDYMTKDSLTRLCPAIERELGEVEVRKERLRLQLKLTQSDRMASVGMLAAGVAHEINNPLSYLLYIVESLEHDLPDFIKAFELMVGELGKESARALIEKNGLPTDFDLLRELLDSAKDAKHGAERIRNIVRDLKNFSHVEDDIEVDVDVNRVIERSVNMAFNEIKYRSRLEQDYGDISQVLASEGRLSQVILNLLVNAAQAINEGDVDGNLIRIRTCDDGDFVLVEISDTGHGISEENRSRLFEAHFTTKPQSIGSGLGLSICRNIVESYGGLIDAKSQLGVGSVFSVRLPRSVHQTIDVLQSGSDSISPDVCSVIGKLMVVDDDPLVRTALKRVLGMEHEVVTVESGSTAKELLKEGAPFDVILCDVMMPHVSGIDLHEWLEEHNPDMAARMVFITGGTFTERAIEFFKKTANPQFEKPFNWNSLRTFINVMIEKNVS